MTHLIGKYFERSAKFSWIGLPALLLAAGTACSSSSSDDDDSSEGPAYGGSSDGVDGRHDEHLHGRHVEHLHRGHHRLRPVLPRLALRAEPDH